MTQENDAADRAQEFNDVSVETTVASNESFAQDWLEAEEKERAEQSSASPRSRLVATLPDWTTFGKTENEKKRRGDWRAILRNGKLRTTGVALAAFGLGVWCASGFGDGEKAAQVELGVAEVESASDVENGVWLESGIGDLSDASPASIDSSTLRSVPNSADVGFISRTRGETGASTASDGALTNVNDWVNNNVVSANVESGTFDSFPQTSTASAGREDESNWRRGVDFQRNVEAPASATASVDRFPTWDELGANRPTVSDILSSPIASSAPAAANAQENESVANNSYLSENAGFAQDSSALAASNVGGSVDYAAYNEDADYQNGAAENLNVATPQFAGNSQNSGYNQTAGSENFAGWPTTAPAPAPNYATNAPAPTPNYASTAPAPTPNYATTAPAPAPNYATTAPAPAPNYASTAPAPTPNYASNAPAPAPNYASVAPASAPNYASTEAPRAMVAHVPGEGASGAAPTVPAGNPNLRW